MNKKILVVIAVLVIAALACGQSSGSAQSSTGGNTGGNSGGQAAAPTSASMPVDVQLPPGAYDIQVSVGGTQVDFKLDGTIEEVVAQIAEALDSTGWTTESSPDSAVGSMASMRRTNEAGDIASLNMSYNQNGNFVTIYMSIQRVK